jgi:hypothetical protein
MTIVSNLLQTSKIKPQHQEVKNKVTISIYIFIRFYEKKYFLI